MLGRCSRGDGGLPFRRRDSYDISVIDISTMPIVGLPAAEANVSVYHFENDDLYDISAIDI